MELQSLIKTYLKEAKLMQLGTSVDNQPWICNVWYAADENLTIYFFSATNRRHSKEIEKNAKVCVSIVLPQTPTDKPRGVQMQGTVEKLSKKKDIDTAIKLYTDRIFDKKTIKSFMDNKEKPHKFYRIIPSLYVLFDAANFPANARQELPMI